MGQLPITDEDQLITLGDYVDRGPGVREVLNWLISRHERGTLRALAGNHEEVMLEARDDADTFADWLGFGGRATLASYNLAPEIGSMGAIPAAHWQFLEQSLLDYVKLDQFICVHGNLERSLPLAQQTPSFMRWAKFPGDGPMHVSGKTILCGHTAQRSGEPRVTDHTICIDTCAYGGGWLTAFDVETRRYWQANERGEFREWKA